MTVWSKPCFAFAGASDISALCRPQGCVFLSGADVGGLVSGQVDGFDQFANPVNLNES